MMKWEERLVGSIRKNILWWAVAAAGALGIFLRYSFMPLIVADMEFMLSSWYKATLEGGMAALAVESTYSPLYLYLFPLLVRLNMPYSDAIKLSTFAFEIVLFAAGCLTVYHVAPQGKKKGYTALAFILLCFHPLLILGGAGWGQSDICFAAFSILAVWCLMRGKSVWAMVHMGIALALKLQAVLLLPLFVIYYFTEKKFSLWQFLIIPAIWVATGLPMAFFGQSPLYAVTCYLGQVEMYPVPTYNYPNFYALLGDALGGKKMIHGMFSRYGMGVAIGGLGGMAAWLIAKRAKLTDSLVLVLGSWCVLCAVFFMPRMHERYGLVGEMLLLYWAVCLGKPRGYAYVLLGLLPVASAYCKYMFRYPMFPLQLGAFMNLALLGLLTWEVVRGARAGVQEAPKDGALTGNGGPVAKEAL